MEKEKWNDFDAVFVAWRLSKRCDDDDEIDDAHSIQRTEYCPLLAVGDSAGTFFFPCLRELLSIPQWESYGDLGVLLELSFDDLGVLLELFHGDIEHTFDIGKLLQEL